MVCVNAALLYARFHFHFYSTATVLQISFIRKGYERGYYYYSLKRAHTSRSLPECGSVLCTVQPRYTDPEEIIELRLEKKKNLLFFATPNVLVFFLTTRPNLIRPWGNGQLIQFHPSLLLPFCQVHLYESIKNDKKEWKKRKEKKKILCLILFPFLLNRVVFYSPDMLKHPFSITLFEDWMYWSDWDRNAIFKADKFTGKNAQAVTSTHLVRG